MPHRINVLVAWIKYKLQLMLQVPAYLNRLFFEVWVIRPWNLGACLVIQLDYFQFFQVQLTFEIFGVCPLKSATKSMYTRVFILPRSMRNSEGLWSSHHIISSTLSLSLSFVYFLNWPRLFRHWVRMRSRSNYIKGES